MEKFTFTADSSYKLIVENKTINRIRAKSVVAELFYALPKEARVNYLYNYLGKDSIVIKNILYLYQKSIFLKILHFLFIMEEEFYLVANTKQNKTYRVSKLAHQNAKQSSVV